MGPLSLYPPDEPLGKILVVHDYHIAPVDKKIHPVSAAEHIEKLRNTERSHHAVLLVFKTAEPDLRYLDLIFIDDPGLRQDGVCMP